MNWRSPVAPSGGIVRKEYRAAPHCGISGSLGLQGVQEIYRCDVRSNHQQKLNQQKNKVMKTKNTVIGALIRVTQSKWIQPALMTVALVVVVLGVAGCDSGHGGHGR